MRSRPVRQHASAEKMSEREVIPRGTPALMLVLCVLALLAAAPDAPRPAPRESSTVAATTADFKTETLRGKVVWLDEALARRHAIVTEPDSAHAAVALETSDGRVVPIVLDTRGRAFIVDERLRDVELQMRVRSFADPAMIQIVRLYRPKPDGLYEIDYWCDVCAIPMYILKPCECCQGPTRLREQKVEGESPNSAR